MKLMFKVHYLFIALLLFACKPEPKPRLVVVISFDHLAYNTYSHYLPVFTGGLKWFHDHGITFDNAHHEHGYTSTGPGHFVLGSGLYPGPAGILGNNWYGRVSGKNVYCVEDSAAQALDIPTEKVSYGQVNGTTYGDWLKAVSPESKVYSVATKDRASIMMGGRNPDLAIWYNWNGAFTSTDYYTKTIPAWLHKFNAQANMISYRDSVWTKSLPESSYAEYTHGDSFYGETDRYLDKPYSPVFPIGFESQWDDAKVLSELGNRPWMDRQLLDLARVLIDEEQLGQDGTPDILSIGLSTMDLVAHYYGPYSHEVMDHLVKTDQYLMNFINYLDNQVGLENIVFALSSDHGGLPLPEHRTKIEGKPGGRIDGKVYSAARESAYAALDSLFGDHRFIYRSGSSYFYNQTIMDSMQVEAGSVDSILQMHMESVEGVYRLYSKAELLDPDPSDQNAVRLSHFMHSELSPDLYTLEDEGWLFRNPYGTSHGTPYEYDSHVPILFSALAFETLVLTDSVSTTDLAPTIGDILGVAPLNKVDGISLKSRLFKAR